MPFIDTPIEGLKVFLPKVWEDERGYFFESFNQNLFEQGGVIATFVQDNQARSAFGVLRGLHYQVEPYAQAKLVRVLQGEVLDVAVDIRDGSPTYGQSYTLVLSAENRRQLFIPQGFAHGYVVLSETAEFFYKCDNYYSKEHASASMTRHWISIGKSIGKRRCFRRGIRSCRCLGSTGGGEGKAEVGRRKGGVGRGITGTDFSSRFQMTRLRLFRTGRSFSLAEKWGVRAIDRDIGAGG